MALLLAGLLAPAGAGAHAAFLSAQPEPGTRLQLGPAEISLTFTEPLSGDLSDGSLVDAATEEKVPATVLTRGRELVLRPQVRLGRAPYEVNWHTVSTLDGHALEGSFGFGVRTAALSGEHTIEQSPLARGGWVRIWARALLYVALFYFAGGLFAAALISRRDGPAAWLFPSGVAEALDDADDRRGLAEGAWIRTIEAGWYAVAAAASVALLEAADAAGGLDPGGISDYLLSSSAGMARAATIPLLVIAALLARRLPLAAAPWLGLAFLSISFSGHANSAEPSGPAVFNDWLHLLAGGIWLGGIAQVAVTWLPRLRRADSGLRRAVMGSVLPRFGEVAVPAFLLVAFTGVTSAIFQLGHLDALWSTPYGRVLMVKVALVVLIALASYAHAIRLRPRLLAANPHPPARAERRHWRALSVEPVLGLAVLAAAAALVAFPLPPRQLGEADEAQAAAPCRPSCPLPAASASQLPVAEQTGSRIAAFWIERTDGSLSGTLRLLNVKSKPVEASVEVPGAELSGCGAGCWRFSGLSPRDPLRAVLDGDGVTVPARWNPRRTAEAKRLLRRAQAAMRGLHQLRLEEALTSGLGFTLHTRYRFVSPDRMAYRNSQGGRMVAIGGHAYRSTDSEPFRESAFGASGFRYRELFAWTIYGRTVRWLGSEHGQVHLALFDPGTPLWYRLTIDRRSGRVLRERMVTNGHFMSRRYFAFNRPLTIRAPR
jgi:copper transport protein